MNTENYTQEKGVNSIKLPSMDSVYNNLRYLLSAMTLMTGVSGVITEGSRVNLNVNMLLFAIIILLSGLVLAFTSYKKISQPYKDFKNIPLFNKITHIILTAVWVFGGFIGLLVLVILVIILLKI